MDVQAETGEAISALKRGAPDVLVAVSRPLTAKLIAKALTHAGHTCRLVDAAEAMSASAAPALAIVELAEGVDTLPAHVVALYELPAGVAPRPGSLGKPVDPDLLIQIVGNRLRPQVAPVMSPPPAKPPGAETVAIDQRAIDDLRRLGGDQFVREVVEQFYRDADLLLATLKQDVRTRDVTAFQENTHALRSCAANIGANAVYQFCLKWRETSEGQLEREGESFLQRLEAEIARVRAAGASADLGTAL